ncbi:Rv1733c family protein [Streptomyces nodosus]
MATTRRTAGAKVWLWRWRRNPLRRPSDLLEAWVVLATWVLVLLAGVLAGRAAAGAVEHGLAERGARAHPVAAVLAENAAVTSRAVPEYGNGTVWAKVRWTAAGTPHEGLVAVEPGLKAGSSVTVWTDQRGDLVSRPATAEQMRLQAGLVGSLVGLGTASGVLVCGWLVRGRLERQRLDAWDKEWETVGPRWRRTIG